MRRTDHKVHSRDEIVGYLRDAVEIVDEADVPPGLAEIAYSQAVELLAGKQIQWEQIQSSPILLDRGSIAGG